MSRFSEASEWGAPDSTTVAGPSNDPLLPSLHHLKCRRPDGGDAIPRKVGRVEEAGEPADLWRRRWHKTPANHYESTGFSLPSAGR